jgi:hypothetical protein
MDTRQEVGIHLGILVGNLTTMYLPRVSGAGTPDIIQVEPPPFAKRCSHQQNAQIETEAKRYTHLVPAPQNGTTPGQIHPPHHTQLLQGQMGKTRTEIQPASPSFPRIQASGKMKTHSLKFAVR